MHDRHQLQFGAPKFTKIPDFEIEGIVLILSLIEMTLEEKQ